MTKEYAIHQIFSLIHWPSFFRDWGFDPQFSKIASLQGCDVVRASWLTDFKEKDRIKAAEAMQLLKEANRTINLLDKDYKLKIETKEQSYQFNNKNYSVKSSNFNLDIPIDKIDNYTNTSLKKEQLIEAINKTNKLTFFVSTIDNEVDLLFEKDNYKRKLVQTLAPRFTEAATLLFYQNSKLFVTNNPIQIKFSSSRKPLLKVIEENIKLDDLGIKKTKNHLLIPHATHIGYMFPNYIIYQ